MVSLEDSLSSLFSIIVLLFFFNNIDNNDWLVVNQLAVHGSKNRRPDLVVYINGESDDRRKF